MTRWLVLPVALPLLWTAARWIRVWWIRQGPKPKLRIRVTGGW